MVELDVLVLRCQDREQAAFDQLFNLMVNQVHSLSLTILRDADEAADATQETFVRVYERIDSFRGQSQFKTWVISITVNTCRDRLRRRKLRRMLSLERLTAVWQPAAPAKTTDPALIVPRQMSADSIWQQVDQLGDKYRLPIILFYQYDYSCEEIADVLNVSVRTIYNRLSQARKRLKTQLKADL